MNMKNLSYFKSFLFTLLLLLSGYVNAQQITIKGNVTESLSGTELPGVNVIIEGTSIGTVTDIDGNYSIDVETPNDILIFSFIGYLPERVELNGKSSIDIVMIEDITSLDELVVIGYGAQKKSDLTGAVSVVDVKEMTKTSNSNMGSMLQGRVAGVNVTSDGQPGADPTIRIRGIGTFNNNDPLYVIDGVIVDGIRDFSPNDVETMQVLKDASAAAIYGSRAANGVIIITTKQGKKNSPLSVAYKGYYGIDKVTQRMPVLGRENYQAIYNHSLTNNDMPIRPGNDPESSVYINNVDTDWQSAGLKTGKRQNHNVAMTGGGNSGTYAVILDYLDSKGTLEGVGPDYTRYSVRSNTTLEKKFFKAGASLTYTHTDQNSLNNTEHSNFSGGASPMINTLTTLIPTMKVYDENGFEGWGTYDPDIHGEDYSLNIIGINSIMEDKVSIDRILANGYGLLKLGELFGLDNYNIDYKLNVSYDKTNAHDFLWIPEFAFSNFYTNNVATLQENSRWFTTGLIENTLNFRGAFGQLNTDIILGQTFQAYDHRRIDGNGQGFSQPYYPKLSNATETSAKSYEEQSYMTSYLGRVNLDYANKYLLTATVRRDGTSRVSKEYRYGVFPSFSAGWKVHNESFFNISKDIISMLKIRGGWGKLGNQAIGPYEYLAVLNRNVVYNFTNTMVQGSTESDIFPQKLLWEEKIMSNIGADMSFFKNKLEVSAEYYNALTDGILVDVQIPLTVGSVDRDLRANAAQIRNTGLEFMVGYKNYDKEFKYDVSVNASTINNTVESLGTDGQPRYGAGSRTIEGQEIGRHYGYVYEGIFQTQDEVDNSAFQTASTAAGDIKFKDISGPDGVPDGIINDDDKYDLGSALPNFTYGINLGCEYKNFDLTVFMNGAAGFLVNDNNYRQLMHTGGGLNWHEDILNTWTPNNTNTDIPRVVYQDPNGNSRDSDRPGWLQKGDYFRIANISLGYTFHKRLLFNTFESVRLYTTVQNLHTFTSYKGFNPDFSNTDAWSPGFNYGSYPLPTTIMFGLNFDF